MFDIKSELGDARVGELKTKTGRYGTPFFMPVATMGTGKCISTDDYRSMGARNIICNAFVLSMMPGADVIKEAGGIHKFIDFDGCVFTDCGGFQASRQMHEKSSKKALHFVSPFDGSKQIITPERIMNIEMDIGCDVAMALDSMAGYGSTRDEFIEAMKKTHRWAEESLKFHTDDKQLLFGICQGGYEDDLRRISAHFIDSLDFDGVAIGGLAIGEPRHEMYKALDAALPKISKSKPRYVMGEGNPVDILECVSRGVDCFDSVYPTKNGRHDLIFTWDGMVEISKGVYKKDFSALDEECGCFVCKNFSKAYMYHLSKLKEPAGKRYRSYHNLYFMQRFMERIRLEIKEGSFDKFKEEFKAKWKKL